MFKASVDDVRVQSQVAVLRPQVRELEVVADRVQHLADQLLVGEHQSQQEVEREHLELPFPSEALLVDDLVQVDSVQAVD